MQRKFTRLELKHNIYTSLFNLQHMHNAEESKLKHERWLSKSSNSCIFATVVGSLGCCSRRCVSVLRDVRLKRWLSTRGGECWWEYMRRGEIIYNSGLGGSNVRNWPTSLTVISELGKWAFDCVLTCFLVPRHGHNYENKSAKHLCLLGFGVA